MRFVSQRVTSGFFVLLVVVFLDDVISSRVCVFSTSAYTRGNALCQACPAGKFSNTSGQALCMPCPPGTFNQFAG